LTERNATERIRQRSAGYDDRTMLEERALSMRADEEAEAAFLESMPATYREAFTSEQIREHAAISFRRGDRLAHLELWRGFSDGLSVFCVVADDRPGLLSNICRVLVAHELEVLSAQIHCRARRGKPTEAFDLFWVRPAAARKGGPPLDPRAIEALAADVESALYVATRSTVPPPGARPRSVGAATPPRVFFNASALRRGSYVLIVEALDCPGLLLSISLALHREGVQILGSDVRTEAGLARDCFELAGPGGAPFSSERLAAIRKTVVDAVRERLAESA
jgi:UTP:GlnB (protein PII) uridylyltransferase